MDAQATVLTLRPGDQFTVLLLGREVSIRVEAVTPEGRVRLRAVAPHGAKMAPGLPQAEPHNVASRLPETAIGS